MDQFIGFNIGSSEYMIPILKVREIMSMPAVTALPHLPAYITGVTNLRGNIIPIVNLRHLLHSQECEGKGNTIIVLASGKISFGIIVDGITGVVKVNESDIEPPENFFNNWENIQGVAKINNKLIVLLDTRKLLPLDDMSLFEDAVVDVKETDDGKHVEVSREVETIGGKVIVRELHDAKEYLNDRLRQTSPHNNVYELMLHFMDALAAREYQRAEDIVHKLINETDSGLFNEVGRITRNLHESLEDFKGAVDNGLQRLTEDDVPNAIDKLEFVINKTEEAANNTMEIIERYFEESDAFSRHIENLKGNRESVDYLRTFKAALDNDMTSILTAQQFQDITGQTIKKIIDLIHNVEVELIALIRKFEMKVTAAPDKAGSNVVTSSESKEKSAEKITQCDVEALLNDCGF